MSRAYLSILVWKYFGDDHEVAMVLSMEKLLMMVVEKFKCAPHNIVAGWGRD